MNTPHYIVAIEVGSSKIKGAAGLVDDRTGSLQVIGIEEEHQHPNYVRYGCVQNVKEVANELNQVITRLNNRLTPAGSQISAVYLGVGGRSLKVTPTRLSMQMPDVTEVTPEIVSDLLSRARVDAVDTDLLDVEPMSYQVDGKNQGVDPVGVLGSDITANVNLVTCRTRNIRNMQLAVNEKLNLKINGYVVRPMAMADLALTSDEKRLGTMLVDCGAETTTVAIYKEGVLVYLATLPLGGRHITRDLTQLRCTEEKAEEIKRSMGNANPDAPSRGGGIDEIDTSAINTIVSARAAEIIANIVAQIGYAELSVSDLAAGIVLVGGGSMLQGFAESLAQASGLAVRRGSLPPTVKVSGTKISTGEDLDVISLLYRLANEPKLEPCVLIPEPKAEDVPPVPHETKPVVDDPENEDFSLDDDKSNEQGFFQNMWRRMREGVRTPRSLTEGYSDDEEDSFTE